MNKIDIICGAEEAWQDYCQFFGIENPLNKRLLLLDKYSRRNDNGSWVIDEYNEEDKQLSKQLDEEKYAYMRMRDRFEVDWIAKNAGWNIAYEIAFNWNNEWNDLIWYFTQFNMPCEYDGCNIFCENFEKCAKEGFVKWN